MGVGHGLSPVSGAGGGGRGEVVPIQHPPEIRALDLRT